MPLYCAVQREGGVDSLLRDHLITYHCGEVAACIRRVGGDFIYAELRELVGARLSRLPNHGGPSSSPAAVNR